MPTSIPTAQPTAIAMPIPTRINGFHGEIRIPGDKSISHRSLMFSALVNGTSTVHGLLPSADVLSTLGCLQQLGQRITPIDEANGHWRIEGQARWSEPNTWLDCGNSGTTMRLMAGLIAGQSIFATLSGDVSLNKRPMGRVLQPLASMGANAYGRNQNRLAPLCFVPSPTGLTAIHYTMPVASAQVKSAILLAGLYAEGTTVVTEPLPSRDHTERMLTAMGAALTTDEQGGIHVQGNALEHLHPMEWLVPGDPSSAAFMTVMATLCPNAEVLLKNVGLNPHRTGLFEALKRMGANITVENERVIGGEPVGDVLVRSAELAGDLSLEAVDIPALVDEIPILAVAAVYLQGTLTVHGADELRKKESDRLLAMQTELAKVGINVTLFEDGLQLTGNPDACLPTEATGVINTWHDHRIAMAMASLNVIHNARQPQQACQWLLDDTAVVAVSFPSFFDDVQRLAR